jgi:ribosomal protein L14
MHGRGQFVVSNATEMSKKRQLCAAVNLENNILQTVPVIAGNDYPRISGKTVRIEDKALIIINN